MIIFKQFSKFSGSCGIFLKQTIFLFLFILPIHGQAFDSTLLLTPRFNIDTKTADRGEPKPWRFKACLSDQTRVPNLYDSQNPHGTDCPGTAYLKWDFNSSHVWFEVGMPTNGFIRLAFSTSPSTFEASDVIHAWVSSPSGFVNLKEATNHVNNKNFLQSFRAEDDEKDVDLVEKDYVILYGYENSISTNPETIIAFIRKLNTCNPLNHITFTGDTIFLHWAYNGKDPEEGNITFPGENGLIGGVSPLALFNHPIRVVIKEDERDVVEPAGQRNRENTESFNSHQEDNFNLTMRIDFGAKYWAKNKINLSIPSNYLCQLIRIPTLFLASKDNSKTSLDGPSKIDDAPIVSEKIHITKRSLITSMNTHKLTKLNSQRASTINKTTDENFAKIKNIIDISEALKPHLKHVVLYGCSRNLNNLGTDDNFQSYSNTYPCYQSDKGFPDELFYCNEIITGYVIGASKTFHWPDEAGYSLGTDKDPELFMLEILLDYSPIIDLPIALEGSSALQSTSYSVEIGFQMSYTRKIRAYDAGVLAVGPEVSDWYFFPPGITDLTVTSHCSSQCTAQDFPRDGINIYASQSYSHGEIDEISSTTIRGGREIGYIARDGNYQTDYQITKFYSTPTTVLPGDHILTRCHYRKGKVVKNETSSSKENPTTFSTSGLLWYQKPCMQFLFYYPKLPTLTSCKSEPNQFDIYEIFRDPSLLLLQNNLTHKGQVVAANHSSPNSHNNYVDDEDEEIKRKTYAHITNKILKETIPSNQEDEENRISKQFNFPPKISQTDLIGSSIYDLNLDRNGLKFVNGIQLTFYLFLTIYPWNERKKVVERLRQVYSKGNYQTLCRDINRSPITENIEHTNEYPTIYQSLPKLTDNCPKEPLNFKTTTQPKLIRLPMLTKIRKSTDSTPKMLPKLLSNESSGNNQTQIKSVLHNKAINILSIPPSKTFINTNLSLGSIKDLYHLEDDDDDKDSKIFRIQIIENDKRKSTPPISIPHNNLKENKDVTKEQSTSTFRDNLVVFKDIKYISLLDFFPVEDQFGLRVNTNNNYNNGNNRFSVNDESTRIYSTNNQNPDWPPRKKFRNQLKQVKSNAQNYVYIKQTKFQIILKILFIILQIKYFM